VGASVSADVTFDNDLGVDLSGLPSTYTIDGLPTTYTIDISNIPKIEIAPDPITLEPITIEPLDISVRIKEIPSIRAHIPALFTLGFSVLGYELFCARLCGEAQVITEPYHPNPCEHCGQATIVEQPPRTVGNITGKEIEVGR
jgi:hypothetical protein